MSFQFLISFLLCLLVVVLVQSEEINSSKGQSTTTVPILAKQVLNDEDYDLTDKKGQIEGSGVTASLDDYADEDEDDQLSKITATLTTTTIRSTTTTSKFLEQKKMNTTATTRIKFDDLDANEFNEDYKDDLEDAVDYNELTTKLASTLASTTRSSTIVQHRTPLRVFFAFLTRPPIAAGILAGLAIGILTSVILLICIVQRFQRRQRTHSSYTTGLLYPNQYGYSKSPQEFYA